MRDRSRLDVYDDTSCTTVELLPARSAGVGCWGLGVGGFCLIFRFGGVNLRIHLERELLPSISFLVGSFDLNAIFLENISQIPTLDCSCSCEVGL